MSGAIGLTGDRRITIDLSWLLNALSDEQKRELVDSLSCEDSVIEDVAAQLLDGWTAASSHGAMSCDASEPSTPLSRARRELAMRAGEAAATEIAELVRQLKWQNQLTEYHRDAYWMLRSSWPDGFHAAMPSIPPIPTGDPNLYTVEKKGGAK